MLNDSIGSYSTLIASRLYILLYPQPFWYVAHHYSIGLLVGMGRQLGPTAIAPLSRPPKSPRPSMSVPQLSPLLLLLLLLLLSCCKDGIPV